MYLRKQNRLNGYDYSSSGYYYVTICIKNRLCYFGEIQSDIIILNQYGEHAQKCWLNIPSHFPNTKLDEFIIMPNHIHGIIIIENSDVVNKNFCSLQDQSWQKNLSHSLSSIIRGFKIGVTKYFRSEENYEFQWQKSFYDHIIHSDKSLHEIRKYIVNNPLKWALDEYNL